MSLCLECQNTATLYSAFMQPIEILVMHNKITPELDI